MSRLKRWFIKIEYQHPRTGERFTLSYNSTEGEQFTTAQKPDHILTLKKEGSQVEYKFIFDAKYRINPALPGSNYYNTYGGIPGPEEETINTMHRYRDAIVKSYQEKPERVVVGAFVLFLIMMKISFKNIISTKVLKKLTSVRSLFCQEAPVLFQSF